MTDKKKPNDDGLGEALEDLGESAARFLQKAFEKSEEFLGNMGVDDLFGDLEAPEGNAPGTRRKPKGKQQTQQQTAQDEGVREPAIDLFEEGDSVLIYVELPGVDEESIDIARQNGSLLVSALAEREVFSREIELPEGEWGKPKRHFKNGILKIELKKKKTSSKK